MITELWHHWSLLRLLFIFVLAAPLFVLAALPRGHGRSRGRKTHDAVSVDTLRSTAGHSPITDMDETGYMKAGSVRPVPPGDIDEGRPGPESERSVEASPHEWRGGVVAPDRRAA
jgi:hypothetical protein